MNTIKTGTLMVTLTFLLVMIGKAVGGEAGMAIALLFSLGTNFVSYFFSDKIVLSMYRAREADENSAPELYDIVMELSTRAGLPMPKVYIIDEQYANAFATGRNPEYLASALLKLQVGADRIHADVNPSAAHMFIVNPLSGD